MYNNIGPKVSFPRYSINRKQYRSIINPIFSVLVGCPRIYLSCNLDAIMQVSRSRHRIPTFCINWIPAIAHLHHLYANCIVGILEVLNIKQSQTSRKLTPPTLSAVSIPESVWSDTCDWSDTCEYKMKMFQYIKQLTIKFQIDFHLHAQTGWGGGLPCEKDGGSCQ